VPWLTVAGAGLPRHLSPVQLRPDMLPRLPALHITRAYFGRGATLWLAVRLSMIVIPALIAAMEGGMRVIVEASLDQLLRWNPSSSAGALTACMALGFVDVRVRNERVFLGNLGLGDAEAAMLYLIPAVMGEALMALGLA
jgi:hypothetical protein